MYKPSKIKHPSPGKNKKSGDPAYASGNTPAGPEATRSYAASEPQPRDRPAEEARKPIVNQDEQKKVVNQPASATAPAGYDDSEES